MSGATRIRRVLLGVLLSLTILCPGISFSKGDSDDKWSLREWGKLVPRLFPQKPDDSVVAFRIVDDGWHSFPEYSFSFGMRRVGDAGPVPEGIVADVREANGGSIYKQIVALHRRNPSLPGTAIQNLLIIDRFHLSEKDCPEVHTQFEKFKELRIAPLQFRGVILDAPRVDFWISAGDGNMLISMDAGPGSEDYPLMAWASETRRSFDSCHARLTDGQ